MFTLYFFLLLHQGFGSKCGGSVLGSGLSQAEKDEILRVHNELRSKLASGLENRGRPGPQPSAADMEMMVRTKNKYNSSEFNDLPYQAPTVCFCFGSDLASIFVFFGADVRTDGHHVWN